MIALNHHHQLLANNIVMKKIFLLLLLISTAINSFSQTNKNGYLEEIQIANKSLLDTILIKSFSNEELEYIYSNTGNFSIRVYVDTCGFVTNAQLISITNYVISALTIEKLLCNTEIYGKAKIPDRLKLIPTKYRYYIFGFIMRKKE